jgi:Domain of unknown function (DUF4760)
MTPYEISTVSIASLAVLVNLGALIFLAMQVRQAVDTAKRADLNRLDEWARQKRESTMQFYMSTVQSREKYKTALPSDRDADGIKKLIEDSLNDAETHYAIRVYINYMEMVSTGVNSGVLDVDVIDRMMSIVPAWNNYWPWIKRQREKFDAPQLSDEFELLASVLAQRNHLPCTARDYVLHGPDRTSDGASVDR